MQYKKKRRKTNIVQKIKAVDVLYERMVFYRTEAVELGIKIVEMLKQQPIARGDKIADMYKQLMRLSELTIDCASKLAQYQSPKLQSVETKNTNIQRFVIRGPTPLKSPEQWLAKAQSEQVVLQALPPPPKVNNTNINNNLNSAINFNNDQDDNDQDYELSGTYGN